MSFFPNAGSMMFDSRSQSAPIAEFADLRRFRFTWDSSGSSRIDFAVPHVATMPALNVSKCPSLIEYFLTVDARSLGFIAQGLFAFTRSFTVWLRKRTWALCTIFRGQNLGSVHPILV